MIRRLLTVLEVEEVTDAVSLTDDDLSFTSLAHVTFGRDGCTGTPAAELSSPLASRDTVVVSTVASVDENLLAMAESSVDWEPELLVSLRPSLRRWLWR